MSALEQVGHRYAGSPGERQMAEAVVGRMPPGIKSRIEGFVAFTSPAVVVAGHALAILLGGLLGAIEPLLGALVCACVTGSLYMEATGRFSFVRRILPKRPSYNVVVPPPANHLDAPHGTVVITAPIDIPRWRPVRPWWLRRPLQWIVGAAIVVTTLLMLSALAQPWGRPTQGMYIGAMVVLALTVATSVFAQRRTGEAEADASGPAALLEIVREVHAERPAVEVWCVFTGCGFAYQNGMGAFLGMRGQRLPAPVLVIALDEPGRGPLGAVVSEGTLVARPHRPTGPALIERLRWAGVSIPRVDKDGVTDARAAQLAGYRAVALSGDGEESTAGSALRAVTLVQTMVRWFAEDLARVQGEAESDDQQHGPAA